MPSFPIVDSHVHLYDPSHLRYSWLKRLPKIDRRYDLADLDRFRDGVEIDKIVFAEVWVDPGLHLEEAAWVQSLADKDSRLVGMVAHAPLEKGPAVEANLEKLKGFSITRGVRRLIEIEMDPGFCLEPAFIEAVKLLPRYGLTFDICVKHSALVFGLELARRCPEVEFVLDHIGKPGIRHGLSEPWKSQIRELSRLPNVTVKVSGVITEADHQRWEKEEVRPYVEHVLDCFGFDRCMYGSDWTVSELTHAYPNWVAILDEITQSASEDEKRAFWRETAIRTYRLP